MDKTLVASVVVILAAVAGIHGVEVSADEAASIEELALQATAGIAGLVAIGRAWRLAYLAKDSK